MSGSGPDDTLLWPDGTECTRDEYERGEFSHMSDDFQVYPVGSIGPCVKQTVTATVIATDGRRFVGTNHCESAQSVCPRGNMPSGVGYELCQSICQQPAHAEVNALAAAGPAAIGAEIFVEGHTYACPACTEACFAAGIHTITIGAPPA